MSDSYQPCEKELGLMREVLKLMIRYQNPVNISTKSTLILRDIDLLAELSKVAAVNLTCTVTCADESIQQVIEPRAANFETENQCKCWYFNDANYSIYH